MKPNIHSKNAKARASFIEKIQGEKKRLETQLNEKLFIRKHFSHSEVRRHLVWEMRALTIRLREVNVILCELYTDSLLT